MKNVAPRDASEIEAIEQREWLESLDYVVQQGDRGRVQRLLASLRHRARTAGVSLPFTAVTAYVNTLRPVDETPIPGNQEIERRIKSLVRWNAMAMVVRANRKYDGIGGHISTLCVARPRCTKSGSTISFAPEPRRAPGDLIYFQGHASPGMYARAFLEGRLTKSISRISARNCAERRGPLVLSASVADARLLAVPDRLDGARPDHVDLPGALHALPGESRADPDRRTRKVWAFLGDGEIDEPESLGAITLASREKLDNLIFVINCNLQRLDGPVRGNGKIIQELEAVFRGAGWNVIKVIWGTDWDPLLARDHERPARQAHGRGRRRRSTRSTRRRRAPTSASISSASIPSCSNWSKHLSDEQLGEAPPRRSRSA